MLRWVVIFIVLAMIAGVFGFTSIAAGAASIAKVLFFTSVLLPLFDVSMLHGGLFAGSETADLAQFRTGMGAANAYPRVGPIIISEIMYHPPDVIVPGVSTNDNLVEEFIELRNVSGSLVPLYDPANPSNGWRLRDGVEFTFTSSHFIPAGGHVVVVGFDPLTNATARGQFQARYGSNSLLLGPYSGKLDNSTESVELVRPDPPQLSPRGTS